MMVIDDYCDYYCGDDDDDDYDEGEGGEKMVGIIWLSLVMMVQVTEVDLMIPIESFSLLPLHHRQLNQ